MSSSATRRQSDFTKLMMAGYELDMSDGSTQDFYVTFRGPKDTIYEGGIYRVHVTLPDQYPFSSPGIGFEGGTVFHPNIDEKSGSVCLDVINQTWTPLYQLVNVFDVFLPQLLTYPNPADPLNSDAAALYLKDENEYQNKVKMYVHRSIAKYEERAAIKADEEKAPSLGGMSIGGSTMSDINGSLMETSSIEMVQYGEDEEEDLDLEFE